MKHNSNHNKHDSTQHQLTFSKKSRTLGLLSLAAILIIAGSTYASAHFTLKKKQMTAISGDQINLGKLSNLPFTQYKIKGQSKGLMLKKKGNLLSVKGSGSADLTGQFLFKEQKMSLKVEAPVLSDSKMKLWEDNSGTLTLQHTTQKVTWTSSDPKVVSISPQDSDKSTLLTAKDKGTASVTAKIGGHSYSCSVTVKEPAIKTQTMKKGQLITVTCQKIPKKNKAVWSIKDPDIVHIESSGPTSVKLIGANVGSTTVIAKVGKQSYTGKVNVTGDQKLSISGSDTISINQKASYHIKNYCSPYHVTWTGAEASTDGKKASLTKDHTGKYTIKAVVDTGISKQTLTKDVTVYQEKVNHDHWKGSVGEAFSLTMSDAKGEVAYDFDANAFKASGDQFIAKKAGDFTIHIKDDLVSIPVKVTIYGSNKDTSVGASVVSYALQFLGHPYVWGGTDLIHGADCSGFTMRIFEHFGIHLPHYSGAQRSYGTEIHGLAYAKAGDLICYEGHVAIYMGGGRIVHASNPRDGVKISPRADYRHIVTIRRLVEDGTTTAGTNTDKIDTTDYSYYYQGKDTEADPNSVDQNITDISELDPADWDITDDK